MATFWQAQFYRQLTAPEHRCPGVGGGIPKGIRASSAEVEAECRLVNHKSACDRLHIAEGPGPVGPFTYLGSIDTGGDVVGSQVSLYTTFWSDTARVLNV